MTSTDSRSGAGAGPLAGIRILDLSAVLSGPMATALLLDQGALVVKVETPEGDISRKVGPAKGDLSAMYIAANRGKRSIALDLKQPAACAIVRRLAIESDVVVENFRPGAMARLGLDHAALSALNPRLVSVSITGFGQTGPYAKGRVYDAVVQGVSGFAASQRDSQSGEPVLLASAVCDKLTALTAAQAITAALFARERDGKGRHIEVAMLDATLAFQWPDTMYNHVFVDDAPPPFPPFGSTLRPWRARDGLAAVMNPQNDEFAALCRGLGRADMIDDPRFASAATRSRHARDIRAILDPIAATMPIAELVDRLREAGVPIGRINEFDAMLKDPQVRHNEAITEVDQGKHGRVRLARPGARFDGAVPALKPASGLGADGREILAELGLDAAEIAALQRSGALRLPA